MPVTQKSDTGNNVVWPTGENETSVLVSSGQTKRVNTTHDISARDVNSLRAVVEGLLNHSHSYEDKSGGGGC